MRFKLCQTSKLSCPFVPSDTRHVALCVARDLHTIAPGHLSVRAGNSSGRSEEIVKKISYSAFQFDYYYYYYYYHYLRDRSGAGIMEADDRQVTTVFTVQPSFHHRHSTNRVSRSVTIAGQRAVTHHLVVRRRW